MASLSLGVALESLSSNPANSISECPQHTPGRALKDTGLEHQYRSIFVKSLSCHRMLCPRFGAYSVRSVDEIIMSS